MPIGQSLKFGDCPIGIIIIMYDNLDKIFIYKINNYITASVALRTTGLNNTENILARSIYWPLIVLRGTQIQYNTLI